MATFTLQQVQQKARTQPKAGTPTGGTFSLEQIQQKVQTQPQGLLAQARQRVTERREQFGEGVERQSRGQQTAASTGFQLLGAGAGLVGDVAFDVGSRVKKRLLGDEGFFGERAKRFGRKIASKIGGSEVTQKAFQSIEELKKSNPVAAANIGAAFNIAGIIPATKGIQVGARLAKGAVTRGVKAGGGILRERTQRKAFNIALEATQPTRAKRQTIQAFEKAGRPGGVVERGGLLKRKIEVEPTARAREIAQDVSGIVKSKNPVKNLTSLNKEITKEANTVQKFLGRRKFSVSELDVKTLNRRLSVIEVPDIIKADTTLNNTYELVRQRMIGIVAKKSKTLQGLWKARIEFDDVIDKQFGVAAFNPEKNSAIKRAYLDVRREVNNFIADKTPDNVFKNKMRKLSNFYEARYNIAENSWRLLGTSKFERFRKNHPTLYKALLYGGGSVIAGKAIERTLGINIPVL